MKTRYPHYVSDDPPLRYEEAEIGCNAAECYRLLCDVARVPDWVPGVANVDIDRFDANGRALVARYVGMPGRGSVGYSVMYAYDDDSLRIQWSSTDHATRDMDGEAIVTPVAHDRCRVRYGLHSSSTAAAPSWASASFEAEAPHKVLESFARWVATQPTGAAASE